MPPFSTSSGSSIRTVYAGTAWSPTRNEEGHGRHRARQLLSLTSSCTDEKGLCEMRISIHSALTATAALMFVVNVGAHDFWLMPPTTSSGPKGGRIGGG